MINYQHLINKYGSPLYIYDLDEITESYKKLVCSLPDKSIIYYSLKANPNPEVTRHLINLGCYAEVSSIGELNTALNAGAHPKKCIYTGPGKNRKEIEYALLRCVNHFSVESVEELSIINDLTKRFDKSAILTLRINPSFTVGKASIKMTGVPSQFGFDEESINNELIKLITRNKNLEINGFHIYNGSNFNSVEMLVDNYKNILSTVTKLQFDLSIDIEFIDFGGGFAAPFGKNDALPDYRSLKNRLEVLINTQFKDRKRPTIAFESGRYLTATCGTLVGTVQSIKVSKGKKYCVVDFGINHIGGMSGLRRIPTVELQLFKENSLVKDDLILQDVTIVGPLCTPLDYLAKNVCLNTLEPNDIVFVPSVGAYGLTGSLLGFLSREIPKEIVIKNKEVLSVHTIKLIKGVDTSG